MIYSFLAVKVGRKLLYPEIKLENYDSIYVYCCRRLVHYVRERYFKCSAHTLNSVQIQHESHTNCTVSATTMGKGYCTDHLIYECAVQGNWGARTCIIKFIIFNNTTQVLQMCNNNTQFYIFFLKRVYFMSRKIRLLTLAQTCINLFEKLFIRAGNKNPHYLLIIKTFHYMYLCLERKLF